MAKVGRPTDYKPEYAEQAFKYCLLGVKDKQLAQLLDVSEQTLNSWKEKHPEFLESLLAGKDKADANVALGLYNRAKGYEYEEETPIKVRIGKDKEEIVIVKSKKIVPTETRAAELWLQNRQNSKWRNQQNIQIESQSAEAIAGAMGAFAVMLQESAKAKLVAGEVIEGE